MVTGAGGGIGASIARRLAGDGFSVALVDVDVTAADRAASGLGQARSLICDVRDAAAVEQMRAQVEEEMANRGS